MLRPYERFCYQLGLGALLPKHHSERAVMACSGCSCTCPRMAQSRLARPWGGAPFRMPPPKKQRRWVCRDHPMGGRTALSVFGFAWIWELFSQNITRGTPPWCAQLSTGPRRTHERHGGSEPKGSTPKNSLGAHRHGVPSMSLNG